MSIKGDRQEAAKRYGTANRVLIEARIAHDPYDVFDWCQEWRFSIAQRLTDVGEYVADFHGADDIREDWAYQNIPKNASVVELRYALRVLDRYREWLRIAGKDY